MTTHSDKTLILLKRKIAWGKEVNPNQLFDYGCFERMIEEAEERARCEE